MKNIARTLSSKLYSLADRIHARAHALADALFEYSLEDGDTSISLGELFDDPLFDDPLLDELIALMN